MNSKYNLILCELHHPNIHGKDANSDLNIETHYLVFDKYHPNNGICLDDLNDNNINDYNTDDEYDSDNEEDYEYGVRKISNDIHFLRDMYLHSPHGAYDPNYVGLHPTIRHFHNIVNRPNYIKAEIAECILLPTQEEIAILKTFWLRIIQKKWKEVFQKRKTIIKRRCNLYNLNIRQTTGKWPPTCDYLPGIIGMLSDLM